MAHPKNDALNDANFCSPAQLRTEQLRLYSNMTEDAAKAVDYYSESSVPDERLSFAVPHTAHLTALPKEP